MKRTLLMVFTALLLLTQCRKSSVNPPVAEEGNTVSMTVTVGLGRTDISAAGAITWTAGDKLYVADEEGYCGFLILSDGAGSATGTFTGKVVSHLAASGEAQPFYFSYLGTGTFTAPEDGATSVDIDFSSQTGDLGDLSRCHVGTGDAMGIVGDDNNVTFDETVQMSSMVAIAYLEFKNGDADYTNALVLSGEHIYNAMTVDLTGGSCTGKTVGPIGLTGTTSAKKYVMLVPTGTSKETLYFGGAGVTGSTTLHKGIEANKFYRMANGDPIQVALLPPGTLPGVFTVGPLATNKVRFSQGNLYYDNDAAADKKWNFEDSQYDFRTYSGSGSCIGGTYNSEGGTPSGDWGLFGWSTGSTTYGMSTSTSYGDYSGGFVDWGGNTIYAGVTSTTGWHTLSKSEMDTLLFRRSTGVTVSEVPNARYSKVEVNGVKGLLIYPDSGFAWTSAMGTAPANTNVNATNVNFPDTYTVAQFLEMESNGAVFLPAAGYRYGTGVYDVGSVGYYWSGTPLEDDNDRAYYMAFGNGVINTHYISRRYGYCVRLVRSVD